LLRLLTLQGLSMGPVRLPQVDAISPQTYEATFEKLDAFGFFNVTGVI
jgi:hypothetical protein